MSSKTYEPEERPDGFSDRIKRVLTGPDLQGEKVTNGVYHVNGGVTVKHIIKGNGEYDRVTIYGSDSERIDHTAREIGRMTEVPFREIDRSD